MQEKLDSLEGKIKMLNKWIQSPEFEPDSDFNEFLFDSSELVEDIKFLNALDDEGEVRFRQLSEELRKIEKVADNTSGLNDDEDEADEDESEATLDMMWPERHEEDFDHDEMSPESFWKD